MGPRTYIEIRTEEGGKRVYVKKYLYLMDPEDVMYTLEKYLPRLMRVLGKGDGKAKKGKKAGG